ncbi:hypothetical protein I6G67_09130 [Acinetobacter johnsonii]|uniref:DUF2235 domain-containing protein n=2 Tax=Acinetobacter johnsonii TaxID=40214 RepID=A0A7T2RSE7_ACIJO|nr:hypothetical protein I6G67_09130 [Acinetobacter johnsonii]
MIYEGSLMFTKTIIKRTTETNSDVSNTLPTAKQDCSDVVHISVFFDGTGALLHKDLKDNTLLI